MLELLYLYLTRSAFLVSFTYPDKQLANVKSTLFFKLFKLVSTFFNLSKSNLSTLNFKLAKSTFLAIFDHLLLHFSNLILLHN